MPNPQATLAALRRLLVGILVLGLAGSAADLLLIDHYEDRWQVIPLVMIGVALVATAGLAASTQVSSRGGVWTGLFQIVMVLLMVTGLIGIVLHYQANMEFKLEMDPTLSGFALFSSVVRAKAPPALAPATLVLLGLVGLVCAFRRGDDVSPGHS